MDGEVVIGITADSSDFDKKLYKLEKELRKREVNVEVKAKDVEATKAEIKSIQTELDGVDKELDDISKDAQRLAELESKLEASPRMSAEQVLGKDFSEYMVLSMAQVDSQESELLTKREQLNSKIDKSNAKLTEQNGKLQEANELYQETKVKMDSLKHEQINQGINNVKNSMEGVIKKVTRWGLTLVGIRSLYMGIRSAISQVLADDEVLKAQIDYIKWSIGTALKPIIEFIVNLVYNILAGVGAIIKLLFGINIFSKSTADNFKKANGSAQKLKKTLAGFDEMNILNEDGSVGIGSNISNAFKDMDDLSTRVDKIGEKIRRWFLGGDYGSLGEAIVENTKKVPDNLRRMFQPVYDTILKPYLVDPMVKVANQWIEDLRPVWEPIYNEMVNIVDNFIKPKWEELKNFLGNTIEQTKPIWEPIVNGFNTMKNNILKAFAPFLNALIDGFNYTFGWLGWHLDHIEIQSEETGSAIEEEVGGALNDVNNIQMNDKSFTVNVNADTSQAEKNTNNWLSNVWNSVTNIGRKIANIFSSGFGGLNSFGYGSGGGFRAKGGLFYPSKLPKLAVGGIINMPGRGIPYNGATIGERGAEAVVPLTDSQQMELLGEAIGRYISVNLTNITELDGRQIARKVEQINQNDRFVLNR